MADNIENTDDIDTTNKFVVGVQGETIVFLRPVPRAITKPDALVLAAYLVALADDNARWHSVLAAVMNA